MQRKLLVIFGDILAFWISFSLMLFIRFDDYAPKTAFFDHLLPFAILFASWIICFYLFGLYDLLNIKPTIPHIRRFALALLVCAAIGILLFYLVPIFGIAPKTNLLLELVFFAILSFSARRWVYSIFSKQISRDVILVGRTPYMAELHSTILENPQLGLSIVSYTGDINEAMKKNPGRKNSLFIFEQVSNEIPKNELASLYSRGTEIIDVAEAYERYFYKIPVDYINQPWIIENLSTKPEVGYSFISRLSDIMFATLIFVLSSPLWLLGGLAVYLYDRGPIFYIHERVGLNGKKFRLYKLRSMVVDAEKNGVAWAAKQDPRITPPGRILRKLHIDEIPQMLNVLRGNLALVGPRPERPEFVRELEQKIPYYDLRHVIRPGFTGWAQIKYKYARSELTSKQKFEYDLYYIKNRNIFMDWGIILRTIQIIFTH